MDQLTYNCEPASSSVESLDECANDEPKSVAAIKQDKENLNANRDHEEHENEIKNCFECKQSLAATPQLIDIAGREHKWHPECFKCDVCHEPMDRATSCHIYKEKILCKNDYIRLKRDNSIKCSRCHWPVGPMDWIRKAGGYVYHLACFNCDVCLRQLNTGEQFAINIQERDKIVRLLCQLHFTIISNNQRLQAVGSTMPINEPTLSAHYQKSDDFAPGQQQQLGCPALSGQRKSLLSCDGEVDTNSINHHQHRVAPPARSGPSQDNSPPTKTAPFNLSANQSLSSPSSGITGGPIESLDLASKMIETQKCTGNSTLRMMSTTSTKQSPNFNHSHAHYRQCTSNSNSSLSSSGSPGGGGGGGGGCQAVGGISSNNNNLPSKSKRVRTTFTEDQLSILQNHFHIDSNPDGQDLERIATITGLSKRVTQVWFQNSRARQKKYMIKRKPGSGMSGICSDNGLSITTNLIASAASIDTIQPTSSMSQSQRSAATTNNLLIDSIRPAHCSLETSDSIKDQLPKYQVGANDGGSGYQSNDGDSWSSKNSDLTVAKSEEVDNLSRNEDDDDSDDQDQIFKEGEESN